jgi:hypothetical protein
MSGNKNQSTARMTAAQIAKAQTQGLLSKAQRVQKNYDIKMDKASFKWGIIEFITIFSLFLIRISMQLILIGYSPSEICGSNLLTLLKILTGSCIVILFGWILSLFPRILSYTKMTDSQKKDDNETMVGQGGELKPVFTKKQPLILLFIILVELGLLFIEYKYVAIPLRNWLLSDIDCSTEPFIVSSDNTDDLMNQKLSKLISKDYLANNPGYSIENILNKKPIDIVLDNFVAPPQCSEYTDYDTCVKGQTIVCDKRTKTECVGDNLCKLEGDKCVANDFYTSEKCIYHISNSDVCTSIDENPGSENHGIWYDLMGKEYDKVTYIDQCGMGKMKNLCEIIDKDTELLDQLNEDFNGSPKSPMDICNGGGSIKMCIGKIENEDGSISWAREYKESMTGTGVEVLGQRSIFPLTDDNSGPCSELTAIPLVDGEKLDYKCLRTSDDTNQNIGKYCKITNTSEQDKCVPKYVGLSKGKDITRYTIVDSESCNDLPASQHDTIGNYVTKYGGENEDKNIIKCSENFPLREGSYDESPDGKFAEMIEYLRTNVTNVSTNFDEGGEKIIYPYGLLRESDPNELFTFYQDVLDDSAPYINTGTVKAPSPASLAISKKITEAQQTSIQNSRQILYSKQP